MPSSPPLALALLLLAALGAASGALASCSKASLSDSKVAVADLAAQRPTTIVHEDCDINSPTAQRIDASGEGKPDIISVMSGGHEICRALDLNFDGRIDRYMYFDDKGQVRRVESDYDRDGRIDEVAIYRDGQIVRKDREMSLDGKVDTWDVYENGKLVKQERDSDGDGKVDEWWTFPDPNHPECPLVAKDTTGDGRPDPGSQIDMCHPPDDSTDKTAPAASGSASPGAAAGSSAPPVASVAASAATDSPPSASSSAAPSAPKPPSKPKNKP